MFGRRIASGVNPHPKMNDGDEDRISLLPNAILIDIVSRLSLKEAARTSVLSSCWVNLWKEVSRLIFDATTTLDRIAKQPELLRVERRKYINWVNQVLLSHKADHLKELVIRFNLDRSSEREITCWLDAAFARQVEKLELDLVRYSDNFYTFPEKFPKPRSDAASMLQASSRKPFSHHPPKFINFRYLKELSLKCVNVTGETIQSLLCECPVLEDLVVHFSNTLIDLEICVPSLALKFLEIRGCEKLRSIKVSNSNIVSLRVQRPQEICLENVPNLVDVYTSFWPYTKYFGKVFDWFSCCTSQLEILSIQAFNLEKNLELYEFPKLPNLKKLVIDLYIEDDESLLGVTYLMKVAPRLQKFVIMLSMISTIPLRRKRKIMKATGFPHQHLRVVEYLGYYGRTSDIELMKYILENSESLMKVIIIPHGPSLPYDHAGSSRLSNHLKVAETRRNYAKQQLQGEVPPHVELLIL